MKNIMLSRLKTKPQRLKCNSLSNHKLFFLNKFLLMHKLKLSLNLNYLTGFSMRSKHLEFNATTGFEKNAQ